MVTLLTLKSYCVHWKWISINHKLDVGKVKNSEFSENSETLENQFFRYSSPSFPFCTIPKTENSELKTSEFSLRHFDQILRFFNSEFLILHYMHYDQTPRFSNSEFSILHYIQNQKLGAENLGVSSKVYPINSFVH